MPENNKEGGLSWTQPPVLKEEKKEEQKSMKPIAQANAQAKLPARPPLVPARANNPKNMPALTSAFVAGILVGVLAGWAWFAAPEISQDTAETQGADAVARDVTDEETPATPARSASFGAGVSVSDQPAGLSVAVSGISVSKPTWVAVYESRSGEPGNALGAKLFFPGEASGSVTLLKATLPGETYFVGLQSDDGDRAYSRRGDAALLDGSGEATVAHFVAQ
jgi:hypothetical protein